MTSVLDVPGLAFAVTPSPQGVWRRDGDAVVADAPARTDLYVDFSGDAEPVLDAATLLGTPPAGDFRLSVRVSVDFRAPFDAGVLLLWLDPTTWAKLCFEYSPAAEPMIVSVVTRGMSDDANAFTVDERSVWLRVARLDAVYALHASTDGRRWTLVRVFGLGGAVAEHLVGLAAQSPTGEGCTVRFERVRWRRDRLADLRDGS